MKLPISGGDAKGYAVLIGVGVLAVIGVAWLAKRQLQQAASVVANINKGTAYEGTGPVGTVGHAADVVSGGLLSEFGGWLGRTVYDVTHPDDGADLPSKKQVIGDNFYNRGVLQ